MVVPQKKSNQPRKLCSIVNLLKEAKSSLGIPKITRLTITGATRSLKLMKQDGEISQQNMLKNMNWKTGNIYLSSDTKIFQDENRDIQFHRI